MMFRVANALAATALACTAAISIAAPARAADETPEIIPIGLLLAGDWVDATRESRSAWAPSCPPSSTRGCTASERPASLAGPPVRTGEGRDA
ncbi:hypothetical protein [Actinoplanes sp. NBRC 101535]|uniref:hypothetical protein n=1 Tax=Actinoplanes sp. NBRC 101535 TaxID=3032196 RepID=UPI0025577B28|nr:hypothetical protein [Actinoplanes sp. NBRC 101535]